jgi:hypothetical protein
MIVVEGVEIVVGCWLLLAFLLLGVKRENVLVPVVYV